MKRTISITAQKGSDLVSFENKIEEETRKGPKEVSHTVNLAEDKFLLGLTQTASLGLLPYGVRWCSADQRSLFIEEAPGYKTLSFRNGAKDNYLKQIEVLTLPFPWLYYGISPGPNAMPYVSHVFCSLKQVKSFEDILSVPPIPNIFNTGAVCTHIVTDMREDLSYAATVNLAIAEFWNSVFNLDVNHFQKNTTYVWLTDMVGLSSDKLGQFHLWSTYNPEYLKHIPWNAVHTFKTASQIILKNNDYYSFGVSPANRMMSQLLVASMTNS